MQITDAVRGADLLKSTARQLLLIRAWDVQCRHIFTVRCCAMKRMSAWQKVHDALSLRKLSEQAVKTEELRKRFAEEADWKGFKSP